MVGMLSPGKGVGRLGESFQLLSVIPGVWPWQNKPWLPLLPEGMLPMCSVHSGLVGFVSPSKEKRGKREGRVPSPAGQTPLDLGLELKERCLELNDVSHQHRNVN